MAKEEMSFPSFDLGIQDSAAYGNLKDAEAFLSGTEVLEDADNLTDKDDEEEEDEEAPEDKKKPAEKKKEAVKKPLDSKKLVDDFLSSNEEEEEDSEEDEKEEDKTEKDEDDNDSEDKGNQFEALSKELYDIGVFTTEDGEEPIIATTPEEFLGLFNEEKKKGATIWLENFLSQYGEDRRDMFDAIFVNGVEPKAYLETFNEIESFENLDLASESNQEKVVRTYYKRAGLAEDKIQAKIDKLKSYGDLEEEANQFHPLIVDQDKKKLENITAEQEKKKKALEEADTEYRGSLTRVIQEKLKARNFDGIPLDDAKAKKAFDYLYTKKWKTPSGELLTDFDKFILETKRPDNIAMRAKIALLALDNFDFSKIEKKAISKESNSLFSTLVQRKEKKSNKVPAVKKSSWDNI